MTRGTAKRQPASRQSPASLRNLKRGHARGERLAHRPKGSGAAAQREIRELLAGATGLTKAQRSATARQYVSLGATADLLRKLVENGSASAKDTLELRRTEDRMARVRAQLGAALDAREEPERKPLDASDRAAFCAKHLTVADGGPFSLAGREWVQREFWGPLDGYRLWLVDTEHACEECRERSGSIVPSVYEVDATRSTKHAASGCRGLNAHVIWLVALHLKRQQGKTTNVAGYAVSQLFRQVREAMKYVSGSEDQSETLFRANFRDPVATSDELGPRVRTLRNRLVVAETESEFALVPTSLAGATGGSSTLVIVDEARDVPSEVFGAIVPQVYARSGWRCPSGRIGHAWTSGDLALLEGAGAAVDPAQPRYGTKCPTCGLRLEPWIGKVVPMSSAQELDGSDADWFHNLCELLEEEPQPDCHVYRTAQVINPKVQRQIVSRSEEVLGRVAGLGDAMAIEAGGVSKRKGVPFLAASDITACIDSRLTNRASGERPAVGFLDPSDTGDVASLVIVEDDSAPPPEDGDAAAEQPWARIAVTRIDAFDPKRRNHPIVAEGRVDDKLLEAYVEETIPLFKILRLRIDDRHAPWVRNMVARLTKKYGRMIVGCTQLTTEDRRLAYNETERRFLHRLVRIPDRADLRQELLGARKFFDIENRIDVREQGDRKKKGVRHLDIAEALAGCCYDVHDLASKRRGGFRTGGGAPAGGGFNRPRSIFGRLGGPGSY